MKSLPKFLWYLSLRFEGFCNRQCFDRPDEGLELNVLQEVAHATKKTNYYVRHEWLMLDRAKRKTSAETTSKGPEFLASWSVEMVLRAQIWWKKLNRVPSHIEKTFSPLDEKWTISGSRMTTRVPVDQKSGIIQSSLYKRNMVNIWGPTDRRIPQMFVFPVILSFPILRVF